MQRKQVPWKIGDRVTVKACKALGTPETQGTVTDAVMYAALVDTDDGEKDVEIDADGNILVGP